MTDLNKVFLYGHVVRDAELKKTSTNLSVASFSIASNYSVKKADGTYENKADFFPLAIYGTFAEKMLPKLLKGQKILIEGCLRQNKWEKDGVKHNDTRISVLKIQIIYDSKKSDADSISAPAAEENTSYELTEEQLAEMYSDEMPEGDIY